MIICRFCGSNNNIKRGITKSGFRKTQYGKSQKYLCKSCGKRFTEHSHYLRMRHDKEVIVEAIKNSGSLREIGKKFNVAHTTIMAWKEKYSEGKMDKYDRIMELAHKMKRLELEIKECNSEMKELIVENKQPKQAIIQIQKSREKSPKIRTAQVLKAVQEIGKPTTTKEVLEKM